MYNPAYGAVKTFMDGIKDAHSQYEMAKEAHEGGNMECARMHLEEAEKRLDGAMVWKNKLHAEHSALAADHVREALLAGYTDWFHSVHEKVMHLKKTM